VASIPEPGPIVSQYHLPGFNWGVVNRVLLLPPFNPTPYPRAGAEVRRSLAAELQQLGQFEVVSPPPDYPEDFAKHVHVNGRFDEAAMLALGHHFNADVVVHVAITQYHPYTRPRLGLVVQAISPQEAKVVASVDGLWDSSLEVVARRARDFYRVAEPSRLEKHFRGPPIPTDGRADELALESPNLFQRFVCHELVHYLIGR
jgi:hypothetical protein